MNLITQLRNNEKRAVFALVGTIGSSVLDSTTVVSHVLDVPQGSTISRVFALVKEPFAAGSLVDIGITDGTTVTDIWFDDLDLATVGVTDLGAPTGAVLFPQAGNPVGALGSAEAVSSVPGLLQIVVQIVEAPVTTGNYV